MIFRTEIAVTPTPGLIKHDQSIVMLGSCFTDNIGEKLERDGFDVEHNPFGPLYNAASICNLISMSTENRHISLADLTQDNSGCWHCLHFASRYADDDAERLIAQINGELDAFGAKLHKATTVIITLGTAYVFEHLNTDKIVGNCHKFPAADFKRYRLSPDSIEQYLLTIAQRLPASVENVIVTISPIRHLADGLHGNQVSKAVLQVGVDAALSSLCGWRYFPAYEIMMDDLRDYRFYAADMKHPSEVAIDYIYDQFGRAYFDKETISKAAESHRLWLRSQHRPLR